jgi:enterochelin esterase-like enzyme
MGATVFVLMLSTGAVVTLARVRSRAVTAARPQALAISCGHVLDLSSDPANQAARVPRDAGLRAVLVHAPTFIGFYVGRQDDRFLEDNVQFDKVLTSRHVRHLFGTYQGGHSATLWRTEAPRWLDFALDSLSPK